MVRGAEASSHRPPPPPHAYIHRLDCRGRGGRGKGRFFRLDGGSQSVGGGGGGDLSPLWPAGLDAHRLGWRQVNTYVCMYMRRQTGWRQPSWPLAPPTTKKKDKCESLKLGDNRKVQLYSAIYEISGRVGDGSCRSDECCHYLLSSSVFSNNERICRCLPFN